MKKLAILLCFFSITIVHAQHLISDGPTFASFWDGHIQPEIDDKNIAGATLTVVQGGKVVFQKGYGYADIANNSKVDGEKTLFRVASVSKLFTWVAIMQLYEAGKLKLEDEITLHLPDLKIPNHYPQKITIKHLMSHTAGFEDETGTVSRNASAMKPLVEILNKEMPKQVRPPGTYSSYSNHGTALATHIVENISQMNFMDYVEQEILSPLGMEQTTFRQSMPNHLAAYNSKGYKKIPNGFEEQAFNFIPLYPVGGARTSGGDMAKFMLMLLNDGRLGNVNIMDSTTSQLMTTPSHQHHPLVNPMRHGLIDMSQNGVLIYGHPGDFQPFYSNLALIPEYDLGVFISINTDISYPGLNTTILRDFIDTYFPEKVDNLTPPPVATLAPFEGSYAMNRYSYDDIFKIAKLAMGLIEVVITPDGYLETTLGEDVSEWVQQEDLIFRHTESSEVLVFERGDNGKITHAFFGSFPFMALEKLEGVDSPLFHTAVFGMSIVTFLGTFGYWGFSFFYKRKSKIIADFPRSTKRLTALILGIVFLFYIGVVTFFSRGVELAYGIPDYAYILFSMPFLILGLMSILGYQVIKIWTNQPPVVWWKKGAITFIWVCLALNLYQWNYWNLIGFNFY